MKRPILAILLLFGPPSPGGANDECKNLIEGLKNIIRDVKTPRKERHWQRFNPVDNRFSRKSKEETFKGKKSYQSKEEIRSEETLNITHLNEVSKRAAKVLGLSPPYSMSRLKKSYQQEIKKAHPDRGGKNDDFLRVRESYEILLKDFQKRKLIP